MDARNWIRLAALLTALAVICGAFGAHALKTRLDPYSLNVWEKAVFYHLVHGVGLLVLIALWKSGVLAEDTAKRSLMLMAFGIVVFSGSLYLLSVTGVKWLGAVTPIGGVALILAWLLLVRI